METEALLILAQCLATSIVITLIIMAIYMYHKKKRVEQKLLQLEFLVQEKINRDIVAQIIDGKNSVISLEQVQAKQDFAKWQAFEKNMCLNATAKHKKLRAEYVKQDNYHVFKPRISNNAPGPGLAFPDGDVLGEPMKLFIGNAFTDPFPSTHDMDDWALATSITDIMILHDISVEQSVNYYVHLKNHFVNHDIVHGIIQFDIYKLIK